MEQIKIISLNIERDLHYKTVLPFLHAQNADAVCLQEILDRDVVRFKKELGMEGFFVSTAKADKGRSTEKLAAQGVLTGTAILTRLPILDTGTHYFYGDPKRVPSADDPLLAGRNDRARGVVLIARVPMGGTAYTIGTTHFTWTPDGRASDAQREDLQKLFLILEQFPDIILCGDFNAPRGGEIWNAIAARYTDNIPPQYTTSLDQKLHKVSGLMYVVDGLFTTSAYTATDVRLVSGVSDHCAVVAMVGKSVI